MSNKFEQINEFRFGQAVLFARRYIIFSILILKLSAQTYSNYGLYQGATELQYITKTLDRKYLIDIPISYGYYNPGIYGFPNVQNAEPKSWWTTIPNPPLSNYDMYGKREMAANIDVPKFEQTTRTKNDQQRKENLEQGDLQRNTLVSVHYFQNPIQQNNKPDQPPQETTEANSVKNEGIEGIMYIPHKPHFLDEEENEQQTSISASNDLTHSEITGIVVGSVMLIGLITSIASVIYFYFARPHTLIQSNQLFF